MRRCGHCSLTSLAHPVLLICHINPVLTLRSVSVLDNGRVRSAKSALDFLLRHIPFSVDTDCKKWKGTGKKDWDWTIDIFRNFHNATLLNVEFLYKLLPMHWNGPSYSWLFAFCSIFCFRANIEGQRMNLSVIHNLVMILNGHSWNGHGKGLKAFYGQRFYLFTMSSLLLTDFYRNVWLRFRIRANRKPCFY